MRQTQKIITCRRPGDYYSMKTVFDIGQEISFTRDTVLSNVPVSVRAMFRNRQGNVQHSAPDSNRQAVAFGSISGRLQTGDILLFSGRTVVSHAIRFFTRSRWSHIGIVVRDSGTQELFLWEATSSSAIEDVEFGHIHRGVQLVRLEDRVRSYNGVVAVRLLTGVDRNEKMMERFGWLFKRLRRAPYRNYLVEYLNVGLGRSRRASGRAFCSQLVAEAYMRMRLLRPEKPSAFYTPRDFSADRPLRLRYGWLTPPVELQI